MTVHGHTLDLWGGVAEIWTTADLAAAVEIVTGVIDEVDAACSTYRPDSQITSLNQYAGHWTDVGPTLWHATRAALWAARATDGLTDPMAQTPGDGGWRAIALDERTHAIRLPEGGELDLGATAKAWCADVAARRAHRRTGYPVLVNLLGDIATAGPPPGDGWHIQVVEDHRKADPEGQDAQGSAICIESGGVATSSRHGTRGRDHVIDPLSGTHARGRYRTASVAAASCTEANAASTATLVRAQGARAWLERRRLPSRLVDDAGQVSLTAGWPR